MPNELSIMLPLSLAVAAVALIAAMVLGVMMARLRRERDEFCDLLVDNYRRCVAGLQGILEQRQEIRQRVDRALRESDEGLKPEAQAIADRLREGAGALRQSLLRQAGAEEDRLRFDFALFHSELGAEGETLARAAGILLGAVRLETAEALREEISRNLRQHEAEVGSLRREIQELRSKLEKTQAALNERADPEELSRAMNLVCAMKRDTEVLIEGLFNGSGDVIMDISDDDVALLEQQIQELEQRIFDSEDEFMSAPEELVPSMGRWVRLRKIRRASLQWLLERRDLRRQVLNLEGALEEIEDVKRENESMLEDFQRMEARISNERSEGEGLKMARRNLTDRVRQLENVENENKYLVRDLESARTQVEESREQMRGLRERLEKAERENRNLKRLESRAESLVADLNRKQTEALETRQRLEASEREVRDLRERLCQVEAAPSPAISEEVKSEHAQMDLLRETAGVQGLSDMLGQKIAETAALRDELRKAQEKSKSDAKMIRQLEVELESLANEYQRLSEAQSGE